MGDKAGDVGEGHTKAGKEAEGSIVLDGHARRAPTDATTDTERLCSALEDLDLPNGEARALVALLRLGSASAAQIARLAGIGRSNVYRVLQCLKDRGVAEEVVAGGQSLWTTAGRDEVVARLVAAHEERLRALKAKAEEARDLIARLEPETPSAALPFVHFLRGAAQTAATYERLWAQAERQVLVFNRPPYSKVAVLPAIVEALARGVHSRAIYEAGELDHPAAEGWRQAIDGYHQAGVEGRVVDRLPMKLAVFDAEAALFTMPDPVLVGSGFPTVLLIEHPDFAASLVATFEHHWDRAEPYPGIQAQRPSGSRRRRHPGE